MRMSQGSVAALKLEGDHDPRSVVAAGRWKGQGNRSSCRSYGKGISSADPRF